MTPRAIFRPKMIITKLLNQFFLSVLKQPPSKKLEKMAVSTTKTKILTCWDKNQESYFDKKKTRRDMDKFPVNFSVVPHIGGFQLLDLIIMELKVT